MSDGPSLRLTPVSGVDEKFDELLDPATVDASLERVSATFAHAKIRGFVPLLVAVLVLIARSLVPTSEAEGIRRRSRGAGLMGLNGRLPGSAERVMHR
jgi:hypothetical protein